MLFGCTCWLAVRRRNCRNLAGLEFSSSVARWSWRAGCCGRDKLLRVVSGVVLMPSAGAC